VADGLFHFKKKLANLFKSSQRQFWLKKFISIEAFIVDEKPHNKFQMGVETSE
jgi:hypothetical protein